MTDQHVVDITDPATLGERFPLRLKQLGFCLMQVLDETEREKSRYVMPPVCEVSAGPFLMGSNLQQDPVAEKRELPQHLVTLDVYQISRYPLTIAEYACFVQITNRAVPQNWSHQLQRPDHPVVLVSWKDVVAYADFLARVTREAWRLPSEAEWEKAARGIDGRNFPWGNDWDATKANTNDGGPRATTAVGSYPSGVSPYGLWDMAGNVWEWTNTSYRLYSSQAADGHDGRGRGTRKVLRGGSWQNSPQMARTAARDRFHHSAISSVVGARLVRGNGAD
jgi:formylglycine-generating enzyme required for sulfatase activity